MEHKKQHVTSMCVTRIANDVRVTAYPPIAPNPLTLCVRRTRGRGGEGKQLVVVKGKLGQYKLLFSLPAAHNAAETGRIFCTAPGSQERLCSAKPGAADSDSFCWSLRHFVYNQKQKLFRIVCTRDSLWRDGPPATS
jgi:hypothetical protein